jgi:Protein of unknown function (DUF1501)
MSSSFVPCRSTMARRADDLGQMPKSRPVTPSNIHATIYQVLGLDPKLHLLDPSGRPTPTLDDPEPIKELF